MKNVYVFSFFILLSLLSCKREAIEEGFLVPFSAEDDVSFIPIDSTEYELIFSFFENKKKVNEDYQVKKVVKDVSGNKHVFRFFSDVDDTSIRNGREPNRDPRYVIDASVYDKLGSTIVKYWIYPEGFWLHTTRYSLKHHSEIMAFGYLALIEKAKKKIK